MKELLKGLNESSVLIHEAQVAKGFYDTPRETGTLLMLMVSELSEALEADKKGKFATPMLFEKETTGKSETHWEFMFRTLIKDSHEDEITNTIIRLLDYAGYKGLDLEWHIEQKLKYNSLRPNKHGKSY